MISTEIYWGKEIFIIRKPNWVFKITFHQKECVLRTSMGEEYQLTEWGKCVEHALKDYMPNVKNENYYARRYLELKMRYFLVKHIREYFEWAQAMVPDDVLRAQKAFYAMRVPNCMPYPKWGIMKASQVKLLADHLFIRYGWMRATGKSNFPDHEKMVLEMSRKPPFFWLFVDWNNAEYLRRYEGIQIKADSYTKHDFSVETVRIWQKLPARMGENIYYFRPWDIRDEFSPRKLKIISCAQKCAYKSYPSMIRDYIRRVANTPVEELILEMKYILNVTEELYISRINLYWMNHSIQRMLVVDRY